MNPNYIAISPTGQVYVTDTGGADGTPAQIQRIQVFDGDGNFIRKWGTLGYGDGEFYNPMGIAISPEGNVYVADFGRSRIQVFDGEGNFIRKWGTTGSGDGQFNYAYGIAISTTGNVYVSDFAIGWIQEFDGEGNFIRKWKSPVSGDLQFDNPYGIAISPVGHIIAAFTSNRIQEFDAEGNFIRRWGTTGIENGQFSIPDGVAVDASGYVYVVDSRNHRIQKFAPPTPSQTYTISGMVTAGGTGLSGVIMNGLPGNPQTDAYGAYSVTVDSCWGGTVTPTKSGYTFNPPSQTYSNVTANHTQDYTAPVQNTGGTITGRVTDSNGNGVFNVEIKVCDLNKVWFPSAFTGSTGEYAINLPPGAYKVQFYPQLPEFYSPEWYDNQRLFEQGAYISLLPGQVITDINAQLDPGGKIAGRVTDASGNGIANVTILFDEIAGGYNGYWGGTDADGFFNISASPGSYKVRFDPSSVPGAFAPEWLNNVRRSSEATVVTVTAGETSNNINAQLEEGGKISGQVTDPNGIGLPNILVMVYDIDGYWVTGRNTNINGDYSIAVLPGSYKVEFRAGGNFVGEYYNSKSWNTADLVTVILGQTTININAQLELGGSISGRVIDASGNAITNVRVWALDENGMGISSGTTDSSGNYTINGVPSGSYNVRFFPDYRTNYITQWFNNKNTQNSADLVSVISGQTIININAKLVEGGTISGRVTDVQGNGISNVWVYAIDPNGSNVLGNGVTDSSGNYTIRGLPTGNYKVQYNPINSIGSYVSEYYNNKNSTNADLVSVVAGQTTPDINAQLNFGGLIAGRVIDAQENGIASVLVKVFDQNGNLTSNVWTNGSGNYSAKGLPTGRYKVVFFKGNVSGNYAIKWYNNKNWWNADLVDVIVGQTTLNINAQLDPGGSISGQVTDAQGNSLSSVMVYVFDTNNDSQSVLTGSTDSTGNYTITGLAAGTYKVQFVPNSSGNNYQAEWYNNHKSDFVSADQVIVLIGQTKNNINAQLQILQSDTIPPFLSITSHTDGQQVTTASISLSGTASDAGKGDNGISQVTVNGNRADNDTATGSGTANWSRQVSLNCGANGLNVAATDNSTNHNSAAQSITINYNCGPAAPNVPLQVQINNAPYSDLAWGMVAGATDNYDPGIDQVASPASPDGDDTYFVSKTGQGSPYDRLWKDYRGVSEDLTVWKLILKAAPGKTLKVIWNLQDLLADWTYTWQKADSSWAGIEGVHNLRDNPREIVLDNTQGDSVLIQRILLKASKGFPLSLKSGGWNLISLPNDPSDTNPATLFGANLIAIYEWNAVGKLYAVPTTVKSKTGFWVAVSQDTSLEIAGSTPADTQVPVVIGWNLVGPVGNQPVPSGPTILAVYGWGWPPDYRYVVPTTAEEGKGYWIAVSSETDIW